MKEPKLSDRLSAVVKLAEPEPAGPRPYGLVCDIGCDHGWIAITLILRSLAKEVIASDLREGPLQRAGEHILQYGLSDRIETVLAGGFAHITPGRMPDCGIIAGMGGYLITDILKDAQMRGVLPGRLVLQPQNGWEVVRVFLPQAGYVITREDMVYEGGKYYTVMLAERRGESCGPEIGSPGTGEIPAGEDEKLFALYGRKLLTGRHPVLKKYLQTEKDKLTGIAERLPASSGDLKQIEDKLQGIDRALAYWGD